MKTKSSLSTIKDASGATTGYFIGSRFIPAKLITPAKVVIKTKDNKCSKKYR